MQFMANVPDKHYDLAIVDPPYGIDADKAQNLTAERRKKQTVKVRLAGGGKNTQKQNGMEEYQHKSIGMNFLR